MSDQREGVVELEVPEEDAGFLETVMETLPGDSIREEEDDDVIFRPPWSTKKVRCTIVTLLRQRRALFAPTDVSRGPGIGREWIRA